MSASSGIQKVGIRTIGLFWSILVLVFGFSAQLLVYFHKPNFIPLNFLFMIVIGFGFTIISLAKQFESGISLTSQEKQLLSIWFLVALSAPVFIAVFSLYETVQECRVWMFFVALGMVLSGIIREAKADIFWLLLPLTGIILTYIFPLYAFIILGVCIGLAGIFYTLCCLSR